MTDQELAAIEDRLAKGGFSNLDAEKLIKAVRELSRRLKETTDDLVLLAETIREQTCGAASITLCKVHGLVFCKKCKHNGWEVQP